MGAHSKKISFGEDPSSVGGRTRSKAPKVGGRKALSVISNSGKPSESKKRPNKMLSAVAKEEIVPSCIAQEGFGHDHQKNKMLSAVAEEDIFPMGFGHDHQKCIEEQKRGPDIKYVLNLIGYSDDEISSMKIEESPHSITVSTNWKPESPLEFTELDSYSPPKETHMDWSWPDDDDDDYLVLKPSP